jgi:hypothetical protein
MANHWVCLASVKFESLVGRESIPTHDLTQTSSEPCLCNTSVPKEL